VTLTVGFAKLRSWKPSGELRSPTRQFSTGRFLLHIDLLAEQGPLLGEPYTRQLDGKLRELRFHLQRGAVRLTYWTASGRRIVLLMVFRKSQIREEREIDRAYRVLRRCEVEEHTVDEEDGR
jgi:phage-related protein